MPEVRKVPVSRGRKVVVYGGPGLGKSTFAASAPRPIFIQTEDGLTDIVVDHYDVASSYDDFLLNLGHLAKNHEVYDTVVVDSGDWLEMLIHDKLCSAEPKCADITSYAGGWGKGYKASAAMFEGVLRNMQFFLNKNKNVVFLCHDRVITMEDPQHGNYGQTTLRCHELVRDKLIEWADEVLFMCPKISVDEEKERASGGMVRVLKTAYSPQYRAKSRAKMPAEIIVPAPPAVGWEAYSKFLTKEKTNG